MNPTATAATAATTRFSGRSSTRHPSGEAPKEPGDPSVEGTEGAEGRGGRRGRALQPLAGKAVVNGDEGQAAGEARKAAGETASRVERCLGAENAPPTSAAGWSKDGKAKALPPLALAPLGATLGSLAPLRPTLGATLGVPLGAPKLGAVTGLGFGSPLGRKAAPLLTKAPLFKATAAAPVPARQAAAPVEALMDCEDLDGIY